MAKTILIAPVEQHIINRVREIRLSLGMTAEYLSKKVSPAGTFSFIANIESAASASTYTDHNLNIIAAVFTEYAKDLNDDAIKKNYTVYDFYPENQLDDTPIVKTTTPIIKDDGPTGALKNLIEKTDYLDKPKTLNQITEYSNKENNKDWPNTSFTSPVDYAVRKNDLERIDLKDGSVLYQKPKS